MSKIETLLGRVFVKYEESTDSFELMRLVDIDSRDKNNKNFITIGRNIVCICSIYCKYIWQRYK